MELGVAYLVMLVICWIAMLCGLFTYLAEDKVPFAQGILLFCLIGALMIVMAALWPLIAVVYSFKIGLGPNGGA